VSHDIWHDFGTGRFWRHLGTQIFAAIGVCAVIIGLVSAIFPKVAPKGGAVLALVVVGISILYGTIRTWPRPIEQRYSAPNVVIRLKKGDLFSEPNHLVVGVTDTFDTRIPDIIDRKSVQAQLVDRLYAGDIAVFDAKVSEALRGVQPIGSISKPGKTERYAVGTVATVRDDSRCYFCVAYTEMNERNEARATMDGLWISLSSLWQAVSAYANGGTVSIPVIGGGQARISQVLPAQDSIRFIALSFMLACRREKICDVLNIVIHPREYEQLDRLEIQSFLKSLRPS